MHEFGPFLRLAVMIGLAALPGVARAEDPQRIVMMPKLVGIQYYDAVRTGVEDADREIDGIEVRWVGPTVNQVEKQIEYLEEALDEDPDLVAVAANDPVVMGAYLETLNASGVRVMSWDGDSDFREFFVNLVDYEEFAAHIVDALTESIGKDGQIAVVTTSFTAPNQVRWIKEIRKALHEDYPGIEIYDIIAAGESTEEAKRVALELLRAEPRISAIIALGVPNVPGVAEAVKSMGLAGKVAVLGNSTPNVIRPYIKDGTVRSILSWNAPDHGYLTVYSAYRLLQGEMEENRGFDAGRLGKLVPLRDEQNLQVSLPVLIVTEENVDQFDF